MRWDRILRQGFSLQLFLEGSGFTGILMRWESDSDMEFTRVRFLADICRKEIIPVFVRKYFSRIKVQERDREYTKKHIQELPVFLYWKNEKLQRLFSGI